MIFCFPVQDSTETGESAAELLMTTNNFLVWRPFAIFNLKKIIFVYVTVIKFQI